MTDLKVVAELLHDTMTGAGWMDDADELIYEIWQDGGIESARKAFTNANEGIRFINQYSRGEKLKELTVEQFHDWTHLEDTL